MMVTAQTVTQDGTCSMKELVCQSTRWRNYADVLEVGDCVLVKFIGEKTYHHCVGTLRSLVQPDKTTWDVKYFTRDCEGVIKLICVKGARKSLFHGNSYLWHSKKLLNLSFSKAISISLILSVLLVSLLLIYDA